MTTKWIIEESSLPEDCTPLYEALNENLIEYKVVPEYRPFDRDISNYLVYPDNDCVVVMGSLNLSKNLRKKAKWIPGIYYNASKYECVNYYAHLGKYLLNSDYIMLPFGELIRQKKFLYEHLGIDRAIFVRPNRGDKTFPGQVVYKEDFEKKIERFGFNQIEPEELVIASSPKPLRFEWRFVMADEEAITGSQYRKNGQVETKLHYPLAAAKFAEEVARNYDPGDKVWVVDVCQTNDEFKLMEIGCFSSAGLYCCDRRSIVREVSKAALKEWQSYYE